MRMWIEDNYKSLTVLAHLSALADDVVLVCNAVSMWPTLGRAAPRGQSKTLSTDIRRRTSHPLIGIAQNNIVGRGSIAAPVVKRYVVASITGAATAVSRAVRE